MARKDNKVSIHLILEVLGASTVDVALMLGVSKDAVVDYSRGRYGLHGERDALITELADLIVEAGNKSGKGNAVPTPAELVVLRRLYLKNEALLDRVKQRLAVGKANREYALKTQELIECMEENTLRRTKDDPIAQIVRVAKARNARRLRNCAVPQILGMEARVAGLEASQKVIGKLLDKHDRGWKRRMIEEGRRLLAKR
jgi:predicted transcriptional regulator